MKNGTISLYFHFNKIIKGPGTSFQFPTLIQKFWKVLKSVDFTKTQKPRYLKNETLFFLQIKRFINYTLRATLWKKIVLQRR